jgi:membrane protein
VAHPDTDETEPIALALNRLESSVAKLPVVGHWASSALTHPLVRRVLGSWVGRVGARTLRDVVRVEIFDRAMTLSAQGFTSIFPVIIFVAAWRAGEGSSTGSDLAHYLGLTEQASQVVEQAVPNEAEVANGFGFIGLLIVLVSATSFSRALACLYAKVWAGGKVGLRGAWRWVAVILAVALSIGLIESFQRLISGVRFNTVADAAVIFIVHSVLWTWVPWVLMSARVPMRLLAPGGVLMGATMVVLSGVGHIYVPRTLDAAANQFGSLGVAFTYITWLFVLSFALVLATILGAVIVRDEGWFARLLRGSTPLPAEADQEA